VATGAGAFEKGFYMGTSKKRLTEGEFATIRPHLKSFADKNVEALHQVMVGGRQQKDIARELDMTPEAVSAMVKRAWDKHVELGLRPDGWEVVNVALPPELARHVRAMASEEMAKVRK
jgi:hypothetical protein